MSSTSRRVSISVVARSPVRVARPSSSGIPAFRALTWSGLSGARRPIAYSRSMPWRGCRTRSAHAPSLVSTSSPSRILVEAADRVEAATLGEHRRRDHVEHGLGGVAVADRRGDAARLVEHQVLGRRGGPDDPAVDGDDRLGGVDLHPERGLLAVDRDPAVGDEHLARPARGDARGREDLLESLGRHQPSFSRSGDGAVAEVLGREERFGDGFPALLGQAGRDVDVERRHLVEAGQPETFEEFEARAVQERPAGRLGPTELDDEAGDGAASASCSRNRRRGCARLRAFVTGWR